MTQPGTRAIVGSIKRGVSSRSGVPISLTVLFEPSLAIVARRIDALGMDIRSFEVPLHRAIKEVMVPSIRRNFDTRGRGNWEDLSEFSLEMRDRKLVRFGKSGVPKGGPLVFTGNLRKVASQINIWSIEKDVAVIRDLPQKIWYGKVHQAGVEAGDIKPHSSAPGAKEIRQALHERFAVESERRAPDVPARPFLVIWPDDEEKIKQIFVEWLAERVELYTKW